MLEPFKLSDTTTVIIDNFTKFLSTEKSDQRKIRLTPNWIEFKISGIVGFYNCKEELNTGFNNLVISDSKKFLDLIGKIGLQNAQYKEPFLYLKNGDTKIKYHTSPLVSAKPVDRKIIKVFDSIIKEDRLTIPSFELDLNDINSFFSNINMMGYNFIKFESKNNSLKIIGCDDTGIDAGYYEENLNIKIKEKINVGINKDFLTKMFKGNYKVYFSEHILRFESLDIKGLEYYLSVSE